MNHSLPNFSNFRITLTIRIQYSAPHKSPAPLNFFSENNQLNIFMCFSSFDHQYIMKWPLLKIRFFIDRRRLVVRSFGEAFHSFFIAQTKDLRFFLAKFIFGSFQTFSMGLKSGNIDGQSIRWTSYFDLQLRCVLWIIIFS